MIPKIIHYCWFGGNPIPDRLQKCIDSWKKFLPDYTLMRWDESNCSFEECLFVKYNHEMNGYAFVSDYYRLKALYEYGGIYMDTDVMVYRPFDDLLQEPCFLGFNYDCCIGTAVIGAEKGNPFIGELLDMYNHTVFTEEKTDDQLKHLRWSNGSLIANRVETNNYYFTWHLIDHYPQILLNNCKQAIPGKVAIYPKEMFELGKIGGKYYTIHLNDGSWHSKNTHSHQYERVKNIIARNQKIFTMVQIMIRTRRSKKVNPTLPFYTYAQSQMK